MAVKGEPIKWITVKGRRVPIYEDGGMGGFTKGKNSFDEKSSNQKKTSMDKEQQKIQKEIDEIKNELKEHPDDLNLKRRLTVARRKYRMAKRKDEWAQNNGKSSNPQANALLNLPDNAAVNDPKVTHQLLSNLKPGDTIILHKNGYDQTYKVKGNGNFEYTSSYGTLFGPTGGREAYEIHKVSLDELKEDIVHPKTYQQLQAVTFNIGNKSKKFNKN